MFVEKSVEKFAASMSEDKNALSLKTGRGGCEVFKIIYKDREAVIKIGASELGRSEIMNNKVSYFEMEKLGISQIVAPKIFAEGDSNGMSYIILEYLGTDFRNRSTKNQKTIEMTKVMFKRLEEAYKISLNQDAYSSQKWLEDRKQDILRYFEIYLIPSGFGNNSDVTKIKNLDLGKMSPNKFTWATRDLTPDNIFVNEERLTIIDAKAGAKGVPILDLAMFATLTGEVYSLPNGYESAKLAKNFANEIAEKTLGTPFGNELFKFGEIFQYALSVRFRKNKDPRSPAFIESIRERVEDISVAIRK
ncbi:MAG: hypothetical protein KGH71_04170 [Candidatus Micrarchaeota archaeon]|nr:hypothetical protein [Candidatus Micrarchaeota archaeon]